MGGRVPKLNPIIKRAGTTQPDDGVYLNLRTPHPPSLPGGASFSYGSREVEKQPKKVCVCVIVWECVFVAIDGSS